MSQIISQKPTLDDAKKKIKNLQGFYIVKILSYWYYNIKRSSLSGDM